MGGHTYHHACGQSRPGIAAGSELRQCFFVLLQKQSMPARSELIKVYGCQVDIGGREHALFPLAAACPRLHVIDVPTKLLDALWLPYRKNHDELQAAIQATGHCKAVFAHADVVRP